MNCVMTSLAEDPIPTRYTLLSRLEDRDDQDSWKDFFDTYWRLIYSFQKFKRDRTLGSFKGWLRNIIRWRIADQLRKRTRASWGDASQTRADLPPPDMAEIPDPAGGDPESAWEEEWQAHLLKAALETIKHTVKEEHYQIFDLNVLQQWPARNVARALGVNVGLVYLVKYRLSALLKKEIRRLEEQWNQV